MEEPLVLHFSRLNNNYILFEKKKLNIEKIIVVQIFFILMSNT